MRSVSRTGTATAEVSRHWRVLLACFLGVAAGVSTLPYYTQGIFVAPLGKAFGWSREQMSFITLIGGMMLALLSPMAGALIDRIGVRIPLAISFTAMIVGYIVLSMNSGVFAAFFVTQLCIIGLGSPTGPVSFTRIINQHFSAARGLALGTTLAGTGVMAVVAPPLIARLIVHYDWRIGYQVIAGTMVVIALCSLALLGRSGDARPREVRLPGAGVPAATRTTYPPLFWRLLVTFMLMALGVGGFTLHLVPLLMDAGMSLPAAGGVQSLIGVAVLVGRLGSGILVDRVFAPYVATGVTIAAAAGVACIALFGAAGAAPSAFLIGLALGTEGDVIGYLTARYFGLTAYGRLYGASYGVFALGLGLSPVVMARLQQGSGSYQSSLWLCVTLLVLAGLSLVTLPRFAEETS